MTLDVDRYLYNSTEGRLTCRVCGEGVYAVTDVESILPAVGGTHTRTYFECTACEQPGNMVRGNRVELVFTIRGDIA